MSEWFLIFMVVVAFIAGHFHGYAKAMHYCTKKLRELP